jgi:hypothetical protein
MLGTKSGPGNSGRVKLLSKDRWVAGSNTQHSVR